MKYDFSGAQWMYSNESFGCCSDEVPKAVGCTYSIKSGDLIFRVMNHPEYGNGLMLCAPCAVAKGNAIPEGMELTGMPEPEVILKTKKYGDGGLLKKVVVVKPIDPLEADWSKWAWAENTQEDWSCSGTGNPKIKGCHKLLKADAQDSFYKFYVGHLGSESHADGEVLCADCAFEHLKISPGELPGKVVKPEISGKFIEPDADGYYPFEQKDKEGYFWKWVQEWPEAYQCTCTTSSWFDLKGCQKHISSIEGIENCLYLFSTADNATGSILCEPCANKYGYYFGNTGPISMGKEKPSKICLGCATVICNVCAICHTEGCNYVDYKVTTPYMLSKYGYLRAKTQKVRGYVALANTKLRIPKPYNIIISDDDIEAAIKDQTGKRAFVRPCPTRPRHGFVDSRPMDIKKTSGDELRELFAKAKEADEQGTAELLIVPYIQSTFNAIVTPSRVAIGKGNDGATAGHGSVVFPLVGVPFPDITDDVLVKSRVNKETEDPYIEAVMNEKMEVFFTQLRAGVKIPATVGKDFIPHQTRVVDVINASGDLLEWEAQTKRIEAGTVVCHVGGTLISHYGVHCMQNDIPVMTSRRPAVGEVLEVESRVLKPNPEDVIKGLAAGVLLPINPSGGSFGGTSLPIQKALVAMMTTLHNSAAMSGEDGYWLGMATAIMFRAGMAASHGEARHKAGTKMGRGTVYKLAFKDFFAARSTLGQAQWKFKNMPWSNGYGGKAWATCTDSIIKMDNAIRGLMNEPTTENVAKVVVELNNAVNQAHNGGWWLNKFITQDKFTDASHQRLESVVQGAVAMYSITELMKDKELGEVVEQWKAAGEIEVKTGKVLAEQGKGGKVAEKSSAELITEQKSAIDKMNWMVSVKPCDDPEYVGSYCPSCGSQYSGFSKDNTVNTGTICGKILFPLQGMYESKNCPGLVGWMDKGSFGYISDDAELLNLVDTDEDSDDHVPDDYDPGCMCASCSKYHNDTDSESDSEPDEVDPTDFGKAANVNGILYPTPETVVTDAQANLHTDKNGVQYWHIQFRTDQSAGYHSCNLMMKKSGNVDTESKAYVDAEKHLSFSGSGVNNYIKMESTHFSSTMWNMGIPSIGMLIGIDIKSLDCTCLEVKQNEPKEEEIKIETETEPSAEIDGSNDIPF